MYVYIVWQHHANLFKKYFFKLFHIDIKSLDIKSIITARVQDVSDAFNTKDPIAIAKLYTVDSKIMPPGIDVQFGREGIYA